MATNNLNVAVVGGGIIGISSALCLIESIPNINITIISEKWSPNTTGDVSAGVLFPYLYGNTPTETISSWFRATLKFVGELYWSSNGGDIGIGLVSTYVLSDSDNEPQRDVFADDYVGYNTLTAKELTLFDPKWKFGYMYTSYYAECVKLLPYLLQRYRSQGGKTMQKKINSFDELVVDYDVIINCTGIESFNIASDNKVKPYRGQTIRVYAPWIKHGVVAGDHHVIPNTDSILLGGTKQANNWNTEVNDDDREYIYEGCCRLYPSLRSAQIIKNCVGLRPGREEIRIESEVKINGSDGRKTYIIHNYGHGGSGVTIFWGCAQVVKQLCTKIISKN